VPRYAKSSKRISIIDSSKDVVNGKGECDEKKW